MGLNVKIKNPVRPRWRSTTVKMLGFVMFALGLALAIPALCALLLGENSMYFAPLVPPLLIIGAVCYLLFGASTSFRAVNGLLLVGIAWVLVFSVGSLPFLLYGLPLVDAVFESVSGFTTTGSTVMLMTDSVQYSMLLWRALSQWIGGLMVILIFMYMLPSFGIGRNLFLNELSGSGSATYTMKITNAARSFIIVYFLLTLMNFTVLVLLGSPVENATTLALTTISTGGASSMSDSMVHESSAIQLATMAFMLMGGLNFYLHFTAIFKHTFSGYRKNSEFRLLFIWLVSASVIIYLLLLTSVPGAMSFDLHEHLKLLKEAAFTTVSMGTTAGFYCVDYCQFPPQCMFILFMVTFFGASAGSTSGGVKFSRLIVIFQFVKNSVNRALSPNEVSTVKIDGQPIDATSVHSAIVIFIMYTVTLLVGATVIMMFGENFVEAIGLSLSAVTNVGLGFGDFGPGDSLIYLSSPIKIVLMILMWLGRLEIIISLTFISPQFWREIWFSHRARKRSKLAKKLRVRSLEVMDDLHSGFVPGGDLVDGAGHDPRLLRLSLLSEADPEGLHGAYVLLVYVDGPHGVSDGGLLLAADAHDVRRDGVAVCVLGLEALAGVLDGILLPAGHHQGVHVADHGVVQIRILALDELRELDGLGVLPYRGVDAGEHYAVVDRRVLYLDELVQGGLVLLHVHEAGSGYAADRVPALHPLDDPVGHHGESQGPEGPRGLRPALLVVPDQGAGLLRRLRGQVGLAGDGDDGGELYELERVLRGRDGLRGDAPEIIHAALRQRLGHRLLGLFELHDDPNRGRRYNRDGRPACNRLSTPNGIQYMPMIVQSVQVYGLFGEFDYRLDFKEGLNYIHSPNGYGKSTLMHMVYSALRGDLGYLEETPFQRLDIIFNDGKAMIIEKDDSGLFVQMQKNELESEVGPDEMSAVCKCLYLGPERTVIKRGDGHLVPALEAYAKELSETLRSAKEHTELVDADASALAEMSDAQLEELSKDIKARMEFLSDAGFVPRIPSGYRFPPSRYELSEYRGDYIKIIAGLDEYTSRNRLLAESVVVFKDIVNDLFVNKTLTISDTGKIIVSMDNGASVQLSKLSSGEKQVMIVVYNLLFHCPPGTLAIIDEPEISLHVSWQQKLSGYFYDICRIRGIQMIVATHSPQIIHDKWDLAVELRPDDARVPDRR